MTTRLIANGCSFTQGHSRSNGKSWVDFVPVQNKINLANGGAGNTYICQSTLEFLESYGNPINDIVAVMWSGTSRIDVQVSQSWYNYVIDQGKTGCNNGSNHWIHTGSSGTIPMFETLCKVKDNQTLCLESLYNFVLLDSYLKNKGYRYFFTSYANCWTQHNQYCETTKIDPSIGYHCKNFAVYRNFDFSNWIFTNNQRDCLAEFAWTPDCDDLHPSEEMHAKYAYDFVNPLVQKIHMQRN